MSTKEKDVVVERCSFLVEMPLANIDCVEKVDDEMYVTNLTIHGKDKRFI